MIPRSPIALERVFGKFIGVRREGKEPGKIRFLVAPGDEGAAREIIREVLEATPPA